MVSRLFRRGAPAAEGLGAIYKWLIVRIDVGRKAVGSGMTRERLVPNARRSVRCVTYRSGRGSCGSRCWRCERGRAEHVSRCAIRETSTATTRHRRYLCVALRCVRSLALVLPWASRTEKRDALPQGRWWLT